MINGRITIKDIENFEKCVFSGKSKSECNRDILNQIDYIKLKFFLEFSSYLRSSITMTNQCIYPVDNKTMIEHIFSFVAVSYASEIGEQGRFISFLHDLPKATHPEIFDRFLEALKTVFSITKEDYLLWTESLGRSALEYILKLQTASLTNQDSPEYSFWNVVEQSIKQNEEFIKGFNSAKKPIDDYFFDTYAKVSDKGLSRRLEPLDKYKDSPVYNFYTKYYTAVANIYSLEFLNGEETEINMALSMLESAFESGKFVIGRLYPKFLKTIIAAEIYLSNSVTARATKYFDFGLEIGVYAQQDRAIILSQFHAKVDFWRSFLPFKFINSEAAIKRYDSDSYGEELIEPYVRLKTNKSEESYLNNNQNGATPLIRLLQEYKCARYGFLNNFRAERAKILFDLGEAIRGIFLKANDQEKISAKLFNGGMMDTFDANFQQVYEIFVDNYIKMVPQVTPETDKEKKEFMEKRCAELKPKILSLIEKSDSDYLLRKAYQVDIFYSVSALRLAIDSFDSEIVGAICNVLKKNKVELDNLMIDDSGVTPLQYAIRKYDLFMQDIDNLNSKRQRRPLIDRKIPYSLSINLNSYNENQNMFYRKQSVTDIVRTFPWEENGFLFGKLYATEIVTIIGKIASLYKQITSDDCYYLIVQSSEKDGQTYSDVIDIARHIFSNDNVALDKGADIQDMADTVITYCTRTENYAFLRFLLVDEKDNIKNIINEKVISNETGEFKDETALHTFVNSQIKGLKIASKDMAHSASLYDESLGKLRTFLPLFRQAGASEDIPDENGNTVKMILNNNKELLKDL